MAARAAVSVTAVLVAAVAVLVGGAWAQPASGCTQALISISPCLDYLAGNAESPSRSCCSQLSYIVSSQPECLCAILNADNVDKTRMISLPGQCGVMAPPLSKCGAALTVSPSSGTPAARTPTFAGTGTGSRSMPTMDEGASLLGSTGFIVDPPAVYAVAAI